MVAKGLRGENDNEITTLRKYTKGGEGLVGLLATILRHPVVRLHGGKMRACVIIQ